MLMLKNDNRFQNYTYNLAIHKQKRLDALRPTFFVCEMWRKAPHLTYRYSESLVALTA